MKSSFLDQFTHLQGQAKFHEFSGLPFITQNKPKKEGKERERAEGRKGGREGKRRMKKINQP